MQPVLRCHRLATPDLSLADHVHGFDSLKRSAGRVEGPETLTCSDPPLDGSVILLDDVVQ